QFNRIARRTPAEDLPPSLKAILHGNLFDPDRLTLRVEENGRNAEILNELMRRSAIQAELWSQHKNSWQRRTVETVSFEDDQSERRSLTLDVSTTRLLTIVESYQPATSKLYLPVSPGMTPGPILDIDASDSARRNLNIARRHENCEAITYLLIGLLVGNKSKDNPETVRDGSRDWIPKLATLFYRHLMEAPPVQKEESRSARTTPPTTTTKITTTPTTTTTTTTTTRTTTFTTTTNHDSIAMAKHLVGEIGRIKGLPHDIRLRADSEQFLATLNDHLSSYTLHVIYALQGEDSSTRPRRDEIIKISWLERQQRKALSTISHLLLPTPFAYGIHLGQFNKSRRGGTHFRFIAPAGTEIGRASISYAGEEIPLLIRPSSTPAATPAVLSDAESNPAIELVRNRKRLEILGHQPALKHLEQDIENARAAPDIEVSVDDTNTTDEGRSPKADKTNDTDDYTDYLPWTVDVTLIPDRHRVIVPALFTLALTAVLLFIAWGPGGNHLSGSRLDFITLIPPLMTIYLTTPQEHLITTEGQSRARLAAAAAAFVAVIFGAWNTYRHSPCHSTSRSFWVTFIICVAAFLYLLVARLLAASSQVEAFRLRAYLKKNSSSLDNNYRTSSKKTQRRLLRHGTRELFKAFLPSPELDRAMERLTKIEGVESLMRHHRERLRQHPNSTSPTPKEKGHS
ncbi:hypothetical protein, partial [Actinomyces qiguomingii]|uniref:hypothetical protein n=1 Tax=Actinomyces qiguomingii TaxID=2057800 RepID=UPI0018EB21EA